MQANMAPAMVSVRRDLSGTVKVGVLVPVPVNILSFRQKTIYTMPGLTFLEFYILMPTLDNIKVNL